MHLNTQTRSSFWDTFPLWGSRYFSPFAFYWLKEKVEQTLLSIISSDDVTERVTNLRSHKFIGYLNRKCKQRQLMAVFVWSGSEIIQNIRFIFAYSHDGVLQIACDQGFGEWFSLNRQDRRLVNWIRCNEAHPIKNRRFSLLVGRQMIFRRDFLLNFCTNPFNKTRRSLFSGSRLTQRLMRPVQVSIGV